MFLTDHPVLCARVGTSCAIIACLSESVIFNVFIHRTDATHRDTLWTFPTPLDLVWRMLLRRFPLGYIVADASNLWVPVLYEQSAPLAVEGREPTAMGHLEGLPRRNVDRGMDIQL